MDDKPGLAAAGHELREPLTPGLTPQELAELLAARIEEGIGYARRKRRSFRAASSWTKSVSLALSAASTIILGLQDLSFWAGLGFALGAAVTVVNAVEPSSTGVPDGS